MPGRTAVPGARAGPVTGGTQMAGQHSGRGERPGTSSSDAFPRPERLLPAGGRRWWSSRVPTMRLSGSARS
jgi:hypothetical protein